jgi:carbohydrate-selective porin OprB
MAISPMLRGLRSGFGKLAIVSGFALILVILALPTFALPGDQPATVDPAIAATATTADTAVAPDSQSVTEAPKPLGARWMHQDTFLNWGPERQRWADKGFTFDFHYITDALGDTHASDIGRSPSQMSEDGFHNWQRIRGTIDYDFGKTSSAKGLSFHATGVWQNGTNMGGIIGSIANPSGITSSHQFRLDSIWLQQAFYHNKVAITAGILAAQDFYGVCCDGAYVAEPMFYNFGNMGNTRMSYDPESAPGVNLKITPNPHVYVQTGYYLPSNDFGDSNQGNGYPTGFVYKANHYGATSDTEIGYYTDPNAPATRKSYPGYYRAGFVYNGSNGSNVGVCHSNPIMGCSGFFNFNTGKYEDDNYSFYFWGIQPVFRTSAGSNRGLDLWFGINTGPQSKSQVPTEIITGVIFNGPFPGRSKDSLAAGMTYSKLGSDWKTFEKASIDPACTFCSDEKQFEVNYLAQVFNWLTIQPVYQYYANVGGRNNGSATVAGFRLITHF